MRARGFSLVELMVTVGIAGVLATTATHGVRKYVLASRAAEARNNVGQMAKDASTAYARESMAGTVLATKSKVQSQSRLCVTATRTVPQNAKSIKGQKYQSSPAEWAADSAKLHTGFACLKFTMTDPQYYMYTYNSTGGGADGDTFNAIANGDLNGDGVLSIFQMDGKIQKGTSGGLEVTVSPNVQETNPEE